jgi:hypothetical protein
MKSTVWFRCDHKNTTMFHLNTRVEITTVPLIGDVIHTTAEDFAVASYRVRPFYSAKGKEKSKNYVSLDFKVISREYTIYTDEWELLCEPTAESLVYLLKTIKTKN